jgi:hypothetical protein
MNNILYKFFYIVYVQILKNPYTEDEDEFPKVSIMIISFLTGFNLNLLGYILFDFVFNAAFGLTIQLLILGFVFIFYSLLFGINKNYKNIYNYYKDSGIEKKEVSTGILVIYIYLTLTLPIIYAFLR